MEIKEVKDNKKQFLSLLLLADEQENMIEKYIDRGIMYVLDDEGIILSLIHIWYAQLYWS